MKVVISCSMDGTVRAFDMTRYRNFKTLTTPRPVQLGCVSVDSRYTHDWFTQIFSSLIG